MPTSSSNLLAAAEHINVVTGTTINAPLNLKQIAIANVFVNSTKRKKTKVLKSNNVKKQNRPINNNDNDYKQKETEKDIDEKAVIHSEEDALVPWKNQMSLQHKQLDGSIERNKLLQTSADSTWLLGNSFRFAGSDHSLVEGVYVFDFVSDTWNTLKSVEFNATNKQLEMFAWFLKLITVHKVALRLQYRSNHCDCQNEPVEIVHGLANFLIKLCWIERNTNPLAIGYCPFGRPINIHTFKYWLFERGTTNPYGQINIDWQSIGFNSAPVRFCACQGIYPNMQIPHRIGGFLIANNLMPRWPEDPKRPGHHFKCCPVGCPIQPDEIWNWFENSVDHNGQKRFIHIENPEEDDGSDEPQQLYFVCGERNRHTEASYAADNALCSYIGTKRRVVLGFRSFSGFKRKFYVPQKWINLIENIPGSMKFSIIGGRIRLKDMVEPTTLIPLNSG